MDETGIISLYQTHAAEWAARRQPKLERHKWLDQFLANLPRQPHVLYLGCGTGNPLGRYLIARGARLTGIDAAPGMIAQARQSHPGQNWQIGDMRLLDLKERFDGILAWNSFFHLTAADQRAMFARFAAHALPDAPLMFTSGPDEGVAMGEMFGKPLFHASLSPAEYRTLLAGHGFAEIAFTPEDPDCGGHSVWLARKQQDD